ncbi:MAG TPA: group 1 truncated hemoglobin [Polyangia bacterium]
MRAILLAAVFVIGCASSNANTTSTKPAGDPNASLYDRLGKKEAITLVVGDFVGNVAADTKINSFFAKTDIPHFKQLLVEQICQATGGPCQYSGKDMKTAHEGMNITDDQFNALVGDLVKALDKYKVGDREKKELLAALGGMKGDIVGH